MYEGKKVRLRALRREDAPFFVRWMNSTRPSATWADGPIR